VPIRETVYGLNGAFEGIDKIAFFGPPEAGENITSIPHVPEGAIVLFEQLSLPPAMLNSSGLRPIRVIVPMYRLLVPAFVIIKDCREDEPPGFIFPKFIEFEETEILALPNNPPARTVHT
jgi:hypothetical protein